MNVKKRLEYLRKEIRAERISYSEIAELQSLSKYIDDDDIELLQWAGVSEEEYKKMKTFEIEVIEHRSYFCKLKAETKRKAMKKVKELYHNGELESIAQPGSCDVFNSPGTTFRHLS